MTDLTSIQLVRLGGGRSTALAVALFSATSFIAVAMAVGGHNQAIGRVVAIDVAVSLLLIVGLVAELWLLNKKVA